MSRSVANLVNEYLAPEQPDDCREASKATLIAALKASGPVTHGGRKVSLSADGKDVVVEEAPPEEVPQPEAEAAPAEPPAHEGPPRAAEDTPLPDADAS